MTYPRRIYLSIYLAVMVCALTACPSTSDLDRAAKASREIAYDVKTANKLVGEFYLAGKLSLQSKDAAADLLGKIGDKGNSLNEALIDLDRKYPSGTIPPENVQFIRDNIGQISTLFRQLFTGLEIRGLTSAVKDLKSDVDTLKKIEAKL